jgi:hypothetical protein
MGYGWELKTFDRVRWDAIFGSGLPGAEQKIQDALLWEEEGYLDDTDPSLPGWDREQILASHTGRQATALASHLCRNGFTYDGLDATQSERLDHFGYGVCALELLGGDLDARLHSSASPEGIPVGALLARLGYDSSAIHRRLEVWRRSLEEPVEVQLVRTRLRYLASFLTGRRRVTKAQPNDTGRGSADDWPPHGWPRYLPLLVHGRRIGTEAWPTDPRHMYRYAIFSPAEVAELKNEVEAAIGAPVAWKEPEWPEAIEECFLAPLTEVAQTGRWLHMRYT